MTMRDARFLPSDTNPGFGRYSKCGVPVVRPFAAFLAARGLRGNGRKAS
jgi:hypothetical protein